MGHSVYTHMQCMVGVPYRPLLPSLPTGGVPGMRVRAGQARSIVVACD